MDFLNTRAAAEYVGLPKSSFNRTVAHGLIPFDLHPYGGRKFRRADLDAYLARARTLAVPRRRVARVPDDGSNLRRAYKLALRNLSR